MGAINMRKNEIINFQYKLSSSDKSEAQRQTWNGWTVIRKGPWKMEIIGGRGTSKYHVWLLDFPHGVLLSGYPNVNHTNSKLQQGRSLVTSNHSYLLKFKHMHSFYHLSVGKTLTCFSPVDNTELSLPWLHCIVHELMPSCWLLGRSI